MKWARQLSGRVTIVRDFCRFLWQQRLWWMVPMVLVLLVFGVLILFAQSAPVAPFIYTLF